MTDTNVTELRPSPTKGEGTNVTELPLPNRPKDPTAALRQRRRRANRRNRDADDVTGAPAMPRAVASPDVTLVPATVPVEIRKGNDFNGDVTVRDTVTGGKSNRDNDVSPFVESRWQAAGKRRHSATVGRYLAAGLLAAVGLTLSAVGMVETATYSLAVGGTLFCAMAVTADALTLAMPS